jgi:hypothetical protein
MKRREFLKGSLLGMGGVLFPNMLEAKKIDKYHFVMPPKPFEYYIKEGKKRGGRILVIGGIHGNESGSYKASDILIDTEIKRGTLAILPRSNPESIFTNLRGYNGDMNRKFAHISKKDEDYYKIKSIKNFIDDFRPDVVLSLHDGYGFYTKNHHHWGECIVIDEDRYDKIPLYQIAKMVSDNLKKHNLDIPINNTKTFSKNTHHFEQRKSLTYYTLQTHKIPAFCIEASKQTSLKRKTKVHLLALEEFFRIYNVELSPSFAYLISNIDNYIVPSSVAVTLYVANQKRIITKNEIIKLPKKEIKFEVNSRGGGILAKGVNVNYRSFFYRHNSIEFEVKNDNITQYSFIIRS